MNQRDFRLLLAGIGVAVVATLALTVSLWPDSNKNSNNKKSSGLTAGSGLATADGSKQKPEFAKADAPKNPNATAPVKAAGTPTKEIPNTVSTPPVQESIGTALVRDPKTGLMKEQPYKVQVMMLRTADGKPLLAKGMGSIGRAGENGEIVLDPKVSDTGGAGSRPRDGVIDPVKK